MSAPHRSRIGVGARTAVDTWPSAVGKGVAIFMYFVMATVWLPSWLVRLPGLAGGPGVVQDLAGFGPWLVLLVAGLWGLRRLQAAHRI